ncbi:MAG: c(7)-type cytochrome triheme domain-containing protein [Anaeromyxobacter sp.]
MKKLALIAVSLGALLLGGRALAGGLTKLPQPVVLPQSPDSPGVVKFDHSTHVDDKKPNCVSCHAQPAGFSILGRSTEKRGPAITHARMDKGEACGQCHGKGKSAFALDDCSMCHAQ